VEDEVVDQFEGFELFETQLGGKDIHDNLVMQHGAVPDADNPLDGRDIELYIVVPDCRLAKDIPHEHFQRNQEHNNRGKPSELFHHEDGDVIRVFGEFIKDIERW
jgi:hypothetical protein